jgi:UDP-N-acetylglucosamine:LPS N-acetylglucosamine transferase
LHTLAFKVRSVLQEPGRLESMRKNARRLGRPDAGAMIARFVTGETPPARQQRV